MSKPAKEAGKVTPMSGRRAEAARNDDRIRESALAVFVADPSAPISAVAEHAGVGISALYRRYGSKEDLLRQLAYDGLLHHNAEAERALAEDDPWEALAGFMKRIAASENGSITLRLAGTFNPTEELYRESERAGEYNVELFDRAQAAGAIRPGIEVYDLGLIWEQIAAIRVADPERTAQLRQRYLALILDALHDTSAPPPPGPAPTGEELSERWEKA